MESPVFVESSVEETDDEIVMLTPPPGELVRENAQALVPPMRAPPRKRSRRMRATVTEEGAAPKTTSDASTQTSPPPPPLLPLQDVFGDDGAVVNVEQEVALRSLIACSPPLESQFIQCAQPDPFLPTTQELREIFDEVQAALPSTSATTVFDELMALEDKMGEVLSLQNGLELGRAYWVWGVRIVKGREAGWRAIAHLSPCTGGGGDVQVWLPTRYADIFIENGNVNEAKIAELVRGHGYLIYNGKRAFGGDGRTVHDLKIRSATVAVSKR